LESRVRITIIEDVETGKIIARIILLTANFNSFGALSPGLMGNGKRVLLLCYFLPLESFETRGTLRVFRDIASMPDRVILRSSSDEG
jgi:hypothetical protein